MFASCNSCNVGCFVTIRMIFGTCAFVVSSCLFPVFIPALRQLQIKFRAQILCCKDYLMLRLTRFRFLTQSAPLSPAPVRQSAKKVVKRPTPTPRNMNSQSRSFSTVQDIGPHDFSQLLSSGDNTSGSKLLENILQSDTVQNKKQSVQIVDVREANELQALNFTDEFNRIVHLPLSER